MSDSNRKRSISAVEAVAFCLKWAKKYPILVFLYMLPALLVPLDHVVQPYMLKKIIDIVSIFRGNEMVQKILPFVIGYILCILLWETAWRLYSYFVNVKYVPKLRRSIVIDSITILFKKKYRFYQNEMSGKLTKRVMDLSEMPIEILWLILNRGALRSLSLIGSIVMLFICHKIFGFIVICWCIMLGISIFYFIPKIITRAEEFSRQVSLINGEITDVFTNISSVRLFANWSLEKAIIGNSTYLAQQKEVRMERLYLSLFIVASFSFLLLQTISLYFLIKLKMLETITAGDFALVMTINFNVIQNIWELTFDLMHFTKHLGKTQQALQSLYTEVDIEDGPNSKNLIVNHGEIRFDKISFKYKDTVIETFENFSCTRHSAPNS
jgi:ATP-binding cassette subfamily B protein